MKQAGTATYWLKEYRCFLDKSSHARDNAISTIRKPLRSVRPWRERIETTSSLKDLLALSKELLKFRVLDPACGSGNFLYVAYRELVNLEMEILAKIHDNFGKKARRAVGTASLVSTKQFYGIDKDQFAVELAKVTLMLAIEALGLSDFPCPEGKVQFRAAPVKLDPDGTR
jgi:type II restriction/modification system DNA methylase subunit YeeA